MTPSWYRRDLTVGNIGRDVQAVRLLLGMKPGRFDEETAWRVRGTQVASGLQATGVVDEATAEAIGELASVKADLAPEWYLQPIGLWDAGEDVRAARSLLGLGDSDNRFDPDAEAALRRLQSQNRIAPTGILTLVEAKILGDL